MKLPEKSYFSPSEVADRWGCSVKDVQHYLEEGSLRPGIKWAELKEDVQLVPVSVAEDPDEPNQDHVFDPSPDMRFLYLVQENIICRFEAVSITPGMYDAEDFRDAYEFLISEVTSFDGQKYRLVSAENPEESASRHIGHMIEVNENGAQPNWDWHQEDAIVSHEECRRFEREHGISLVDTIFPPVSGYSTDYMKVMHLAIARFFDPRPLRDPKKAEVMEWIQEQLKAADLDPSPRISSAMFTIIKPDDHNPRRRKG